jgi:hypothetical protein
MSVQPFASDPRLFPPLPHGVALHVCLICGGVIAANGVAFHDDWHHRVAMEAIAAQRRLDALENLEGGVRA